MRLVVDANVIIASLLASNGQTSDLIFSDKVSLSTVEFLSAELERHSGELSRKSGLPASSLWNAIELVLSNVSIVPVSEYETLIKRASEISPDPGDIEYLALALKMECPLWSNDKRLKKQSAVRVISTQELLKILSNLSQGTIL